MSEPTPSASDPGSVTDTGRTGDAAVADGAPVDVSDAAADADAYAPVSATQVLEPPSESAVDARRRAADYADGADEPSPPTVLAAMGFGFVPVPFLAMYAVLFISRGFVVPVSPPDVTGSATGEGWVGVGAVVLIVALSLVIAWYVAARRRWPFVVLQLAVLAAAVYCVYDRDTGPVWIPLVVGICSLVALVCAFLPESRRRFPAPSRPRRRGPGKPAVPAGAVGPDDPAPAADTPAPGATEES